jgi:regulator of cell morphogenesis and NO signaling
MFLQTVAIDRNSIVADIVNQDHHTADVFRKYGIEYCCGGRWSLETACMMKGLEFDQLKRELEKVTRTIQLPPLLDFDNWNADFLTTYIINFAQGHEKKYPYMIEVYALFEKLKKDIIPHVLQEEETIFPYICQVTHAYENNDSYAKLLVKTLRKPLDVTMHLEHDLLLVPVIKIRELTNNYSYPEHACISHKVALSRLKELDNDLMQHVYLENEILFPKAIKIEQDLLEL